MLGKINRFFRRTDPVIIRSYGGFVSGGRVHAVARVIDDKNIDEANDRRGLVTLRNTFKRFRSEEHPDVSVQVQIGNGSPVAHRSDREGYVCVDLPLPDAINHDPVRVTYTLDDPRHAPYRTEDRVMGISQQATFGIISDIDDTILRTGVSSFLKWRLVVNSLFINSSRRRSFRQTGSWYKQLAETDNPVFYVSNSPWNMYRYLKLFLKNGAFPEGLTVLRDFGGTEPASGYLANGKKKRIQFIIEQVPDLAFLLIGDAGEEDLEIYLSVIDHYPKRVKGILIRAVNRKSRNERVRRLISEHLEQQNEAVPVMLFRETREAMDFSREQGWIS